VIKDHLLKAAKIRKPVLRPWKKQRLSITVLSGLLQQIQGCRMLLLPELFCPKRIVIGANGTTVRCPNALKFSSCRDSSMADYREISRMRRTREAAIV